MPPTPEDVERPWLDRYPPEVPRTIEIPNVRLPDLVERSVESWPGRDAIRFSGARWSYSALWAASGRFAAALQRSGFRPGDRLGLQLPNCPAYPIAYLGALRAGVIVVQVSPLYQADDLTAILADADLRGLVSLDIFTPLLETLARVEALPVRFVARLRDQYPWYLRPFVERRARKRGLDPRFPAGPRIVDLREAVRTPGEVARRTSDPTTEVAVLQYTGGTTGVPKAAMLTHRNLVANALQCRAWFPTLPSGSSVMLAVVPFFHSYGLTVALNYPLASGTTIVLQIRPDPPETLKLIRRNAPHELPGVPALYRAIAETPDAARFGVRSIRVCVSGSAPLPPEVEARFEEITGGSLVEGYGLTEASPVTHANPVDHSRRRKGTIGLPLPLTDQKVVDLDGSGRPVPTGEPGELAVRGPQVMLGYYKRPEESAIVLRDGWLLTGDVAVLDADGYARIVDRKKDMIDVGGLKVYPREVEATLEMHPSVAEAAVVGAPDPALGEVVSAFVVRRPGATTSEAELIEFVRGRIAHYKAPRTIEFRDALPKSGILKLLRRDLRVAAPPANPTLPSG